MGAEVQHALVCFENVMGRCVVRDLIVHMCVHV